MRPRSKEEKGEVKEKKERRKMTISARKRPAYISKGEFPGNFPKDPGSRGGRLRGGKGGRENLLVETRKRWYTKTSVSDGAANFEP